MKTCIACGMPMNKAADFAMGDEGRDYCVHCARADGTMQSFDEKTSHMEKPFCLRVINKERMMEKLSYSLGAFN